MWSYQMNNVSSYKDNASVGPCLGDDKVEKKKKKKRRAKMTKVKDEDDDNNEK